MASQNVALELREETALITINRPKALNALNAETMDQLRRTLLEVRSDDSVRGLILTGAGRAFVAGADVGEIASLSGEGAVRFARRGQHVFGLIEQLGKPVIAAVNGFALGGGCELALACSMRVASEAAVFGLPEVTLGLIPGYGGTQRLARLVGKGIATEIAVTGRKVDAEEAFRIGLVNRIVPAEELIEGCEKILQKTYRAAPLSVRYVLDAIHNGMNMTLSDGCAHEAALFGLVCSTEDSKEGIGAFLEKRKADFKGK